MPRQLSYSYVDHKRISLLTASDYFQDVNYDVKPPSHQPRSHYVLQKLSGCSKNFVQRSRNAVETDKDVIMVSMDVEYVVEL